MNFSHACLAITGNNTVETTMETQEQGNCRALPYLEHDEAITVELVLAFLLFKCKELDQSVNVVLVWEEQVHLLLCGCQIFVPSVQHWLLPRRGIHFQLPGNTKSPVTTDWIHNIFKLSAREVPTLFCPPQRGYNAWPTANSSAVIGNLLL